MSFNFYVRMRLQASSDSRYLTNPLNQHNSYLYLKIVFTIIMKRIGCETSRNGWCDYKSATFSLCYFVSLWAENDKYTPNHSLKNSRAIGAKQITAHGVILELQGLCVQIFHK